MSEWREPTADERELLRVILLADFPERETLRAQIRDVRVADDCGCGCGSLRFEVDPSRPRLPGGWLLQLAGETDTGNSFDIYLPVFDDDGQVHTMDIAPFDGSRPFGRPLPESLRQFDMVERSPGHQHLASRRLTIVEAASSGAGDAPS